MTMFKSTLLMLLLSLLSAGAAFANEKVNINTADAAMLASALHNVGPAKAEAIVAYREENGAFRSAEQLAMVPGIGLKTVESNRDRIELGAAPARPQAAAPRRPAPATAAKGAVPQR
ncbi:MULTISPECIES: ComEA family DNA-binding protein [Luteimonas]|uniref:ComEA family DNA-binding protein n=1 Tax=Luteimonas TaxID=83614 RepID=UPI000C7B552B|nr:MULTISPECIES: ComEA family DNA-binding protein [Luteimonas]